MSIRELARRADIPHTTLVYNLKSDARNRRIDRDMIRKLASVLPISEDDLMRAAQVAAGYQVRSDEVPDLGAAVVRFLDDGEVSPTEKRRLRARLADILAEEMRKDIQSYNNGGDAQ